jgi:hypothetical protein
MASAGWGHWGRCLGGRLVVGEVLGSRVQLTTAGASLLVVLVGIALGPHHCVTAAAASAGASLAQAM